MMGLYGQAGRWLRTDEYKALRPEIDHACPGVRISAPRPTKAVAHPEVGKPLRQFDCPFGTETYQIVSPRRFQVTSVSSSISRDYQLDAVVVSR